MFLVRPRKCCLVAALPGATYFKPAGIPLRLLDEVRLSVEEAEALRLKELEGLEQTAAAKLMGVSRPTFQRILGAARKKVAGAILNGKAIRIEGGSFQLTGLERRCPRCRQERDAETPTQKHNPKAVHKYQEEK